MGTVSLPASSWRVRASEVG